MHFTFQCSEGDSIEEQSAAKTEAAGLRNTLEIMAPVNSSVSNEVNETGGVDFVGDHNERSLDEEMEEIMDLKGCSLSDIAVLSTSPQHSVQPSSCNTPAKDLLSSATLGEPSSSTTVNEERGSTAAHEEQSMDVGDDDMAPAAQNNHSENDEGFVEEEIFDGDDGFVEDEEGWITPGNIGKIKADLQQDRSSVATADITVGCMTSDFAIQVICTVL